MLNLLLDLLQVVGLIGIVLGMIMLVVTQGR